MILQVRELSCAELKSEYESMSSEFVWDTPPEMISD